MDDLKEVKQEVKDIKKLLIGNGKIGVSEMARRAFEYTQWHKASKNGLLDWTYRIIIATLLSYTALR